MEDYLKEALDIVKAQASVRTMTEDEITSMVQKLAHGIRRIGEGDLVEEKLAPTVDPKKAIREKSIINLEDGKPYKILTKKNLIKFGLTPDEYREKWGYKKGTPLICKSLQRERRKKMKEMQLWTKRKKKGTAKK
ncbi:MucR family transcriptional regulator [Desulfovibrio ferrophilus]|uniref:MucR family transcriptional regulator n=1 Tax=Desulfovibrio ferrophilus TaxID=241368 RepID=A0A2Z6B0N8_9BACT|nr:MucR family transcriptional regulator [Desulfovibrio ferrophilus]BBD09025.1 MucR family transcriptional regulator [Desulfovibrio ferrophilus]